MEVTKEENIRHIPLSRHQEVLKELAQLDPDESLQNIANELRKELNCETVCILLWNEAERKLITEYQSGLPENLKRREEYNPLEGITGKYIFSQGRLINGLVDLENKSFFDTETNTSILDETINWHNMQVFEENSRFKKFKSLLGAPFFNQHHKPGVVKLINKIDEKTGSVTERGFSKNDVETLRLFLKTIEFILQSKWNEKRIADLFTLAQKSSELIGSYSEILNEVLVNCAKVLNYHICLVRVLENGWLNTKGYNVEPPFSSDDYIPENDPPLFAIKEKIALKWKLESESSLPSMTLRSFDGESYYFQKPSGRITSLIQAYKLKSALIVPIIRDDVVLGTFECYTFLSHEFSHQEKDVISKYANSVISNLKRFGESDRLSQIEGLTHIIDDVLSKETLTDLYNLILIQTTTYFGFDYGAISRVNYKTRRIKTEIGQSIKPLLVNPEQWKEESDYSLDDTDILVDIVNKKRSEIISGPEVEKTWDSRLNQQIYNKYNHKELVRIFVPFILRNTEALRLHHEGEDSKLIKERVLGVIEAGYHISSRRYISENQIAFFELFINYCAGAFRKLVVDEEKSALDKILEKLNAQENLLSSEQEIYATLREVVEQYLEINTVSIWEKRISNEPFELKRVAASKSLQEQYDKEDIQELPPDSFTAKALKNGQITEIQLDKIKSRQFAYPQIALDNKLDSMVIVPILIGQEPYAVVDVFLGPDRKLTAEEKEFLELFRERAAIAMIAVQNAKLVNSFSLISETLADDDIEIILQRITDSALEVLHANPVILFRYESDQNKFTSNLITSGDFYYPEVKNIPKEVKENDWPNIILNLEQKAIYLENEQQYLDFQQKVKRVWRGYRFKDDFWKREQIRSLAALRLEHKDEPIGIMFVNYRTPQKFNEPTRKLIEAFAAQAASAIARNRQFWETHRRDSFSLSVSEIVASLSHNSANLLNIGDVRFARFENYVKKTEGKMLEKDTVQSFLNELKEPWDEILADFNRLEEYRKFDEFEPESCQIEDLIDGSLFMLRNRFEKQKINIKKNYTPTPQILCDKHQIQHMLLNLFINALDAMGRKGILSIGTEVKDRYLRIRITDSGIGIPSDLHSEIFKPFFTTKKHGSGLGLPISRYIARKHGGRIDFNSKSGKESTFFIYLPIE